MEKIQMTPAWVSNCSPIKWAAKMASALASPSRLHYTVPLFLPLSVSILSDNGTDILSISVFFLVICYNFVRYRIPVISETCSVTGIGNP